jgi:hypothetical protein
MAKSQIRQYVFTPSTNTTTPFNGKITVAGKYDLSQILLITNSTKNTILYNFADPLYSGTTISFSRANDANFVTALDNTDGVTTITFATTVNTYTGMSASDQIQILYEKPYTEVRMPEIGTDAFERTRVANPQSMLDADFEYGLQPTKWLTYDLMRGYPSVYEIPGTDQNVVSVTTDASSGTGGDGESLITVTTATAHGFSAGAPVTIKGYLSTISGFNRAEGSFIINTVGTPTTFTYYAKAKVGTTSGDVLSTTYTQVRQGGFYTGSSVGTPTFTYSNDTSPSTVTVTFVTNHGFVPGDTILAVTSETRASGPYFVEAVTSATAFTYTARTAWFITGTITGTIYSRPDAFYSHRPFDGGVMLGTGSPSYGALAVRQSKKYIRYQSGKAVNYNTGALFSPNYDVRSITAGGTTVGSTITVVTDDVDHGCQVGAQITITGVTTSGYNGTYVVASIVDERSLTFLATSALGSTTGAISDPCLLSVTSWSGSTVRAGTFDEQNGMFWQYDGQNLAVGRRSSTFQLAGTVAVTVDSNSVVGTNTRFASQLISGDRVVIKGMTHVVSSVVSDTQIYVTPDYRGSASTTGVKAVKTVDYIVPQSSWNGDRLDGSNNAFNPSGYKIDISKMQMIGLQWTWYGAGFIDWMIRGPDGKYITVHRLRNNNLNKEAYMRSGNQPVRYEIVNEGPRTYLTADPSTGGTTLAVADATYFPTSGTVYVDNELISYTGKTSTSLTGCGRAATMSQFAAGSTRSFTAGSASAHAVNAGVILVKQTATPSISHWGSAFLTDGGFDQDRGYIFNYQSTNVQISTKKTTAFAIRLAPSVSNAIVGDLGVRELINRAQLLLQAIEITAGGSVNTNSAIVVEGILNPSNYPTNVANITWNALNSTALQTGQPSFSQIATGTSVTFLNSGAVSTTSTVGVGAGSTVIPVTSIASIQVGDDITSGSAASSIAGATKVTAVGTNAFTTTLSASVSAGTTSTATGAIVGTTLTVTTPPTNSGFLVGTVITGTNVLAGTYITGILTGTATTANSTFSVSLSQTVASTALTATPYIMTAATSISGGTIQVGSLLTGGSVTGGTYVTATNAQSSSATGTGGLGTYYVNQAYSGTPTGGTTPTVTVNNALVSNLVGSSPLTFSRNTYAVPGETVFSFISSPSNKDSLDLTPFKELTNTPIGGRGTFPNGPDVLFINVYLTQGNPIQANLVLRWSEAQA